MLHTSHSPNAKPVLVARSLSFALALLVAGATSGCSVWNDTTDWVSGIFSDEEAPAPQGAANSADRDTPKLGTVPQRPTTQSSEVERQLARNSLSADRDNARYTDEELRGRPSQSTTPPPAPAPVQSATAPRGQAAPAPRAAQAPAPAAPQVAAAPTVASPQPMAAPRPADQSVGGMFASQMQASGARTLAQAGLQNAALGDASGQFAASTAPAMPVTFMGTPGFAAGPAYGGAGGYAGNFGGGYGAAAGNLLATVRFGDGSASLDQSDRSEIARAVATYRQRGGRIRVVGHSSSRTRDMAVAKHYQVNTDISRRRAEVVRAELVRRGVRADAIVVEARGDANLVYYEAMPSAEAYNRRVEIFLEN